MRGCSTSEEKRRKIGEVLERKKLDVLAHSETKLTRPRTVAIFHKEDGPVSGL